MQQEIEKKEGISLRGYFLTHWFTVYTKTSKQEQGAV